MQGLADGARISQRLQSLSQFTDSALYLWIELP